MLTEHWDEIERCLVELEEWQGEDDESMTERLDSVQKYVLFSQPNYFSLCYKQSTNKLNEVYDKVKWMLASYPAQYHVNFYNFIGVFHAMHGHYIKAEDMLMEAVRLKPNSEVALANVVIFGCITKKRGMVTVYMKKLSSIKKQSEDTDLDMGLLFQLFNLNVAAKQHYEWYLNNTSALSNDFALFQYASVLLAHSNGRPTYDKAVDKSIKIFVDINKRDPMFLINASSLVAALNLKWKKTQKCKKGTHPHAKIVIDKLSDLKLNQSHPLFLVGKMLLKIGDVERSKEYLVRSVELGAVSDNLYTLGKCKMKLKEPDLKSAEVDFQRAQKLSKITEVKLLLWEARAMVTLGQRIDAMRRLNEKALDLSDKHDLCQVELFCAEQNIMNIPEVTATLDKTLRLVSKSYSSKVYTELIKVTTLLCEHLSKYYTTTGLPAVQSELFLKWVKFLLDRSEITEEYHTALTTVKDIAARLVPSRRQSVSRNISRRRSSTRSASSLARSETGSDEYSLEGGMGKPQVTKMNRRKSTLSFTANFSKHTPDNSFVLQNQIFEEGPVV